MAPSVSQEDVVNFSRHVDALRRALDIDGGTHDIDDVLDKVQRGEAQLWTSPGAVIVSQIVDAPLARELHFWLAAGELQDVITLSHRVMDWGRKMGCTRATLHGRKGWVRALAEEGWQQTAVVMGREL